MRKRDQSSYPQLSEKTLQYDQDPQEKIPQENSMKSEPMLNERRVMKIKQIDFDCEKPEQPPFPEKELQIPENRIIKDTQQSQQRVQNIIRCKNSFGASNTQSISLSVQHQHIQQEDNCAVPKSSAVQEKLISQCKNQEGKKQEQEKRLPNQGYGIFTDSMPIKTTIFNANSLNLFLQFQNANKIQSEYAEYTEDFMKATFPKSSIFKHADQKEANDSEEEDDQKDQSQKIEENQVIDPLKSTGSYQYESEEDWVFKQPATKVRKDNCQIIENAQVIVQTQQKGAQRISWVTMRGKTTKIPYLIGFLVKHKTELKKFGNRAENIMLSVITKQQGVPISNIVKIQFEKEEQADRFIHVVKQVLE